MAEVRGSLIRGRGVIAEARVGRVAKARDIDVTGIVKVTEGQGCGGQGWG